MRFLSERRNLVVTSVAHQIRFRLMLGQAGKVPSAEEPHPRAPRGTASEASAHPLLNWGFAQLCYRFPSFPFFLRGVRVQCPSILRSCAELPRPLAVLFFLSSLVLSRALLGGGL